MPKELAKQYAPQGTEDRIYQNWCDKGYFHTQIDRSKKPFTIVMPPPNVTGQLHMGHAMDETWQDILTRYKRMQGYAALWVPGTDHAGIATQIKVEEMLRKHTGYTDCPLYQRIQQDIRRRIVEAAAAGNAGISGAPAVNTDL